MGVVIRGHLLDVPGDPLRADGALRSEPDGALLVDNGRIAARGPAAEVVARAAGANVIDHRGAFILPGFIDTHVHFPQLPVIGSMGLPLLRWLSDRTLPAEAALNTPELASRAADRFLSALAHNGTTTALVFGSHLPQAQNAFFERAAASGMRIVSGLSLGDRELPDALLRHADECYRESEALIERWHGHLGLRYAVTPRFSVSCSEAVLDACGALVKRYPDLMVQTHINENRDEIALVQRQSPWARDYFDTYERAGLTGPRAVFAHNLHVSPAELARMAEAEVRVAHCPSSNSFLGSGSFPMQRHLDAGVRFSVACDVGGGTGFSLLKEGLAAYEMQMQRDDGVPLSPSTLLHLITGAAADVLGMGNEVGDLSPGKAADLTVVRPPDGSTLAEVLRHHTDNAEQQLGAIFTLAREESVRETWVAGRLIFPAAD